MIKIASGFLAGVFADLALLWFTDNRADVASVAIGALFVIGLAVAFALSSPARLIRTAVFLAAVGKTWKATSRQTGGSSKAAPADAAEPATDPLELELASALRNFGAKKKAALLAAQQAKAANPAGTFEDLFPLALNAIKPRRS